MIFSNLAPSLEEKANSVQAAGTTGRVWPDAADIKRCIPSVLSCGFPLVALGLPLVLAAPAIRAKRTEAMKD